MEDWYGSGDVFEGEIETAARRPQCRLHHIVELEVRLDFRFVEIVLGFANLFRVVQVVPRLDPRPRILAVRNRLHVDDFASDVCHDRRPYFQEKGMRRGRMRCHRIGHAPVGVALEAQQLCPLRTQIHDRRDGRLGVVGVAVVSTVLELPPDDLAKIAARGKREERIDARSRIDDGPLAREAAFGRTGLGRRDGGFGKAREIRIPLQHRPGVFVGQHLRAKVSEPGGKLLIDLGKPALLRVAQPGASPHEIFLRTRDEAFLFLVECRCNRIAIHGVDALEQRLVEQDLVGRGGELRLPLALERLIFAVGHVFPGHAEHAGHAIEHASGAIERGEGVFERRGGSGPDDRVDFAAFFLQSGFERAREQLRRHLIPRRNAAIGTCPWCSKGVRRHSDGYLSSWSAPPESLGMSAPREGASNPVLT